MISLTESRIFFRVELWGSLASNILKFKRGREKEGEVDQARDETVGRDEPITDEVAIILLLQTKFPRFPMPENYWRENETNTHLPYCIS